MQIRLIFLLVFSVLFVSSCRIGKNEIINTSTEKLDTNIYAKICFGSCQMQTSPLPLLSKVSDLKPDFFVYLGDNIYSDTYDINVLDSNYKVLQNNPDFKNFRATNNIYAVWDDHDFGWNDAGKHYPLKKESKELFLKFWNIQKNSDRTGHEGIYGSQYFNFGTKIIQLILLDTRTFRDNLVKNTGEKKEYKNSYIPNTNPDSTLLGELQWKWLEKTLSEKADLRIIASSIQFGHEYNGWESWTNFPHEQQKFLDLIAKTRASGVIFISGDVHWGEISEFKNKTTYPIYDITSSGITETWPQTEPNKYRIGNVIPQNNFGILKFYFNRNVPIIEMQLSDINSVVLNHKINLADISY